MNRRVRAHSGKKNLPGKFVLRFISVDQFEQTLNFKKVLHAIQFNDTFFLISVTDCFLNLSE